MTVSEREELAENPDTPVETLAELSRDQDEGVRWKVAQNRNTPPENLAELSRDQDWDVCLRVALNPSTPLETLVKLNMDKDEDYEVTSNPKWKRLKEMGTLDLAIAASKYLGIL